MQGVHIKMKLIQNSNKMKFLDYNIRTGRQIVVYKDVTLTYTTSPSESDQIVTMTKKTDGEFHIDITLAIKQ